jgi:hypothetical protein
MSEDNIRDYGLGATNVSGRPRVIEKLNIPKEECKDEVCCPNCQCETLYEIEVDVTSAGGMGAGTGKYIGCPACPWASPCITILNRAPKEH